MKSWSYLIKPASGLCNMRCRYCFYQNLTELLENKNSEIMTEETATILIKKAYEVTKPYDTVSFAFQGGEPTLASLSFFQNFVEIANQLKPELVQVYYSIQTNGLSVDEEWAKFFHDNKFLVGLSIDGNRLTHDLNRIDAQGLGTYSKIRNTRRLLFKENVDVNALCVVTSNTDARSSYLNLVNLGFRYIQFIPCLDPIDETRGLHDFSLTPSYYKQFLCTTFDLWYQDWVNNHYVSVRFFDDLVHLLLNQAPSTCATNGCCGGYLVIEADGSVYPCDFYVMDKYKLGNIKEEKTINDFYENQLMVDFINSNQILSQACTTCTYLTLCHGGCRRDKDYLGQIGLNYYCNTIKTFYDYSIERLKKIALAEKKAQKLF